MASKISKKNIGGTVEWVVENYKGEVVTLSGKIVKVANKVAKVEHKVPGKWETYTAYIDVNDDRIISVSEITGYTISVEKLLAVSA